MNPTPDTKCSTETETPTYRRFVEEIATNFRRVVEGEDGTFSSRCGDLRIERDGSIRLSIAAAKLIVGLLTPAQGSLAPDGQPTMTESELIDALTAFAAPQPGGIAYAPLDLDADLKEHRFYRDALIEECAKVCDKLAAESESRIERNPSSNASQMFAQISNASNDCAAMIRDLKGSVVPSTEGKVMHDPRDDDAECPVCGGEGFVFDCFDGCCEDSEIGCDDCTRPCSCQKRPASPELQEVLREALAISSPDREGK